MRTKMAIVSVMDYISILCNCVVHNLGVATHQWVTTAVPSLPLISFVFLKSPPGLSPPSSFPHFEVDDRTLIRNSLGREDNRPDWLKSPRLCQVTLAAFGGRYTISYTCANLDFWRWYLEHAWRCCWYASGSLHVHCELGRDYAAQADSRHS
jgi:hypothetical protein